MRTVMTNDGPPATISGGILLRGQLSIDIISNLEQSASSNGSACRLGLSLMYNDSRFSKLPISSGTKLSLFSPTDKEVSLESWPIALGNWVKLEITSIGMV